MSASLVGSEMCIRDSSRNAPGTGSRWRRRKMRSRPGGASTPLSILPAVSYTHLTLPTICSV
eukprot:8065591-Alexandrium_andersonii.AAC.1